MAAALPPLGVDMLAMALRITAPKPTEKMCERLTRVMPLRRKTVPTTIQQSHNKMRRPQRFHEVPGYHRSIHVLSRFHYNGLELCPSNSTSRPDSVQPYHFEANLDDVGHLSLEVRF